MWAKATNKDKIRKKEKAWVPHSTVDFLAVLDFLLFDEGKCLSGWFIFELTAQIKSWF